MKYGENIKKLCAVTDKELSANAASIDHGLDHRITRPRTVLWFLPVVTHALKGGVRTVFEFSQFLSLRHGTRSVFVIFSTGGDFDVSKIAKSIKENFPDLIFVVRKFISGTDSEEELPSSDVAFCTFWITAFPLLRYNKTYRKFYFLQDYEPMFYPGGELYMLAEQTYRFGFSAIANSPGVGETYLQYSEDVVSFIPGVDKEVFFPNTSGADRSQLQMVFYGRPKNPRNAFGLGLDILRIVKEHFGEQLRIVSVGSEWSPAEYGVSDVLENLGLLDRMEAVADVYRYSDMGLVFMSTPHPSYQPLEYMACGCVVATNLNEANSWLLSTENALLLEPLAHVAAEKIISLLQEPERRRRITDAAKQTVHNMEWKTAYETIEKRLLQ